jgi:hypothetical protein
MRADHYFVQVQLGINIREISYSSAEIIAWHMYFH